jgi:ABC-type lipoprotein release transport system permease subunit
VALALAVGVAGAVVLTAAAGARRTDTAYRRFLTTSRAEDVYLAGDRYSPEAEAFFADVEGLPQVAAAGGVAAMILLPPDGSLTTPYHFAGLDRRYGSTIDRPKLVGGRLPRPDRADEVLVNRAMAATWKLHVGSTVDWVSFTTDQLDNPNGRIDLSQGAPAHLRVVGIGVYPNEVVATAQYDSLPFFYLSPAYYAAHPDQTQGYGFEVMRLVHGKADVPAFLAGMNRLAAEHGLDPNGFLFSDRGERNAQVERAIRPQAVALGVFALLAGAASLLVLGQVLARKVFADSRDYPALHALGMSRNQLFTAAMTRVGAVSAVGAAIAVGGAVSASPLMPVGPARVAEPHPGVAANLSLLVVGAVAIVALVALVAVLPAWRAAAAVRSGLQANDRSAPQRRSRVVDALAAAGVPATPVLGVRAAVQPGRGRTAVPVRSALVTTGVAIATVVAAFTFTANLDRLARTPQLYGWDWDLKAGNGFFTVDTGVAMEKLGADPDVVAVAGGNFGAVEIAGRSVPAVGLDPLRGAPFPTLLEGHRPQADDEIVLGTRTLRRAHVRVGDRVTVKLSESPVRMRVVGRAVFPKLGAGSFSPTNLGEGAATSAQLFADPGAPEGEKYSFVLVGLRRGADLRANARRLSASLVDLSLCGADPTCAKPAERPGDLSNYARVRATPLVLAGVLGLMALGTLSHTLITSVRRRRRDLAVLKTLGLSRRQVSAVTSWQATTMGGVALLLGVPVGVALGRLAWRVFAEQLGVGPQPATPVAALLLAGLATLILANLIAAVPAQLAARTRPAVVLRSE